MSWWILFIASASLSWDFHFLESNVSWSFAGMKKMAQRHDTITHGISRGQSHHCPSTPWAAQQKGANVSPKWQLAQECPPPDKDATVQSHIWHFFFFTRQNAQTLDFLDQNQTLGDNETRSMHSALEGSHTFQTPKRHSGCASLCLQSPIQTVKHLRIVGKA